MTTRAFTRKTIAIAVAAGMTLGGVSVAAPTAGAVGGVKDGTWFYVSNGEPAQGGTAKQVVLNDTGGVRKDVTPHHNAPTYGTVENYDMSVTRVSEPYLSRGIFEDMPVFNMNKDAKAVVGSLSEDWFDSLNQGVDPDAFNEDSRFTIQYDLNETEQIYNFDTRLSTSSKKVILASYLVARDIYDNNGVVSDNLRAVLNKHGFNGKFPVNRGGFEPASALTVHQKTTDGVARTNPEPFNKKFDATSLKEGFTDNETVGVRVIPATQADAVADAAARLFQTTLYGEYKAGGSDKREAIKAAIGSRGTNPSKDIYPSNIATSTYDAYTSGIDTPGDSADNLANAIVGFAKTLSDKDVKDSNVFFYHSGRARSTGANPVDNATDTYLSLKEGSVPNRILITPETKDADAVTYPTNTNAMRGATTKVKPNNVPDGASFGKKSGDSWASVDPNTGVITLTPPAGETLGKKEVEVVVTGKDKSTKTITVPVNVTNNPLDGIGYPKTDAPRGVETTITPTGDVPPGTKFAPEGTVPGWVKVDSTTGKITVTPPANESLGNKPVKVKVTDKNGKSRVIDVPVTVTNNPLDGIGYPKTDAPRGSETTITPTGNVPSGTKFAPEGKVPGWVKVDPNTGNVTVNPPANESLGNKPVKVKATDKNGKSRVIDVPVNVTNNSPEGGIGDNTKDIDDLKNRADKLEKDVKDINSKIKDIEKKNLDQDKKIAEHEAEIAELATKVATNTADIKDLKDRVSKTEKRLDAVEATNKQQQKELDKAKADIKDLKNRVTKLEKQVADNKKAIEDLSGRLAEVERRLDTGLGKCVGTVGGSILALLPALAVISQLAGNLRIPGLDQAMSDVQRQLNMFDPRLAKAVSDNQGAIAAGFAGLGILGLLLTPGLCGNASVGEAIAEPIKDSVENGELSSAITGDSSVEDNADNKQSSKPEVELNSSVDPKQSSAE